MHIHYFEPTSLHLLLLTLALLFALALTCLVPIYTSDQNNGSQCSVTVDGEEFSGTAMRKKQAEFDMIVKALTVLIRKGHGCLV